MYGSQNGQFGLNTPAYFAIDNFTTSDHYAARYISISYVTDTLVNVLTGVVDSASGPYTVHFISNDIPGASAAVDSANLIWYVPQQGIVGLDTVNYSICTTSGCDTAQIIFNIYSPTGVAKVNAIQTSAYPNPFNNSFTVYHNTEIAALDMYDLSGRLVRHLGADAGNVTRVDGTDLPSGMYIVKLTSANGVGIAKITRQ
jgi:hypothetical protein